MQTSAETSQASNEAASAAAPSAAPAVAPTTSEAEEPPAALEADEVVASQLSSASSSAGPAAAAAVDSAHEETEQLMGPCAAAATSEPSSPSKAAASSTACASTPVPAADAPEVSSPSAVASSASQQSSPACASTPAPAVDAPEVSSPSAEASSASQQSGGYPVAASGHHQDLASDVPVAQLPADPPSKSWSQVSAPVADSAEAAAGPPVSASSSAQEDHRRRRTFPAKGAFSGADGGAGTSSAAALKKASEWTIRVDRSGGAKLGMSINKNKLRVENILPNGLVAAWNRENPDQALEVGCRIVSVNRLTAPDEIFQECAAKRLLNIVVLPPAPLQARASLPSDFQAKEQPPAEKKVVQEPALGDAASRVVADGKTERTVEVTELQTLSLGPFEAGVVCEITDAWYGYPGDESKQIDVTGIVLRKWKDTHEVGMQLSNFNKLFDKDPAPLRFKRLSVSYRLHNVQAWDVSRAKYTEGVSKLGLVLPIVAKGVTNVVGATVAATGYAVGKMETSMKKLAFSDDNRSVADSEVFQWGFTTWLALNGIFPSVTYEDTGKAGVRLRRLHQPDEDPVVPYAAQDMKQTPILLSNHVCYIDGFILPAIFGAPKVLAKAGCTHIPLIHTFAEEIGVVEVDRGSTQSRAASLEAIQRHVDEWQPGQRPLLLFPEGTCSNGDGLLPFKKGAFMPHAPVRPVVIYYTGDWHPANVHYKMTARGEIEPTGDTEWIEQFLGHMVHSLQVKVLPPYIPDEAEVNDPQVYADNVSKLMSEAYRELKAECEQKKEDAERNSWQALARRTLIETPSDMASGLASRLWQGTFGAVLEDATEDSPDRRAANRSSERRRSKRDSESRKNRKHEKHDND